MNEAKTIEVIEDLVRAAGCGMNWMEQVDRARMGSATRGILHVDMGMTSSAIHRARIFLDKIKDEQYAKLGPRQLDELGDDE